MQIELNIMLIENIQEEQRLAIEKKLERKAQEEKEELRREKQGLFQERKKQQAKMRSIEQKLELVHSVCLLYSQFLLASQLKSNLCIKQHQDLINIEICF